MLPLAHLGHYLWIFYVVPVLIVVAGILRSSFTAKRRDSAGPGPGYGSLRDDDAPPAGGTGRDPENGGEAPARRGPSR